MLVLSRKLDESVVVGDAASMDQMLKVTVVEVVRGKVRLGFEAADGVAVHRSEVWEKIARDAAPKRTAQARVLPVVPAIAAIPPIAVPRLEIQ